MSKLIINYKGKQTIYELKDKSMVIGRAPENDIWVDDKKISRRHCEIQKTENGYKLIDLESSNGTRVNNQFVNQKILVHDDTIQIGNTIIIFEDIQYAQTVKKLSTEEPQQRAGVKESVYSTTARILERKHRETTIKTIIIGCVVIVGLAFIAGIYYLLMTKPQDLLEAEQNYKKAIEICNDDPQMAIELLRKIPSKYKELHNKAQEFILKLQIKIDEMGKQGHEDELEALSQIKEIIKISKDFDELDDVLLKIKDFRQKFTNALPENLSAISDLEQEVRKNLEPVKKTLIETASSQIKTHLDANNFKKAMEEVYDICDKFKNDPEFRDRALAEKQKILDKARDHFNEKWSKYTEKLQTENRTEAVSILKDLDDSMGGGNIPEFNDYIRQIKSELRKLEQ